MNSSNKGDKLEDAFHQYLLDQQNRRELVFGVYPPENCKIFKKKSYFCKLRGANVEFDVVIELYGQGRPTPHLHIIFECKNHDGNVAETHVSELSDKLSRMFNHNSKGVMVVSSRLQSGAENLAKNYGVGIVKFDDQGLDIIADRSGRSWAESSFVRSQIFRSERPPKSLKFSAFHDDKFFGDIDRFIQSFDPYLPHEIVDETGLFSVPYLTEESIKQSVRDILIQIDYQGGRVDLVKICAALSIDLKFTKQDIRDADGNPVLGSANFTRNLISINANENEQRERFTLAHEIGHFCLQHKAFLNSENIIERDLIVKKQSKNITRYERLEIQANTFAANLILPDHIFKVKTAEFRRSLGIEDRGHGYIFVDNQPGNFLPYGQLLLDLSSYFDVSRHAVEIKFKTLGMLTDQRKNYRASTIGHALQNLVARH